MFHKLIYTPILDRNPRQAADILDSLINNVATSHKTFHLVVKRLSERQLTWLASFIRSVDFLLLNNFLEQIIAQLEKKHSTLKKHPRDMLDLAKSLYLENTLQSLQYLKLLTILRNDQEHISLAYMVNKLNCKEVLTNKIIVDKYLCPVKEFDGIYISSQGASLIEVKHTLSKYAFRQIFGYLINKKKNRNKHSHLGILLDTKMCKHNNLPNIYSIGIVFNRLDKALLKNNSLGTSLKSMQEGTILTFPTAVFIKYLHEVIGHKDTRIQIKENLAKADIRQIFFYHLAHPDIETVFKEYGNILNKVLITHPEIFVPPNNDSFSPKDHH